MAHEEKKALIAQRIKDELERRGINRVQFANLMQKTPSYITRWLSGKHNFTANTLYDIERKLQIQLFDIYSNHSYEKTTNNYCSPCISESIQPKQSY